MSLSTSDIAATPRPGIRCYVWVKDDETYAGTLDEYARSCEVAYHHGVAVGPLHALTVDDDKPVLVEVDIERTITEGLDFRHIVLSVGEDETSYRIDLRA